MGRDKRWLEVDGVPLLVRALVAVAEVADDTHVVTSSSDDADTSAARMPDTGAAWLVDHRPGQGPLAGIETALIGSAHDIVVIVASDQPFVEPDVLRLLIDRLEASPTAEAAAAVTGLGAQPLLAAYRRSALATVTWLLDNGERRARLLLDELHDVELVPADDWHEFDVGGRSAIDIDTPEDAAAEGATDPTGPGDALADGRRAVRVRVIAVGSEVTERDDDLAAEEPLEIRACGPGQDPTTVVTTMRTPGQDTDLAIGWLFTEGLIVPGDVVDTHVGDPALLARPDDQLTVRLRRPLDLDRIAHRHAVATASCGVCGRASIDEVAARAEPVPHDVPGAAIRWRMLVGLPDRVRDQQPVFAATGGLHATAITTTDGEVVVLREDVGRHNALDAAIGACVGLGTVPLHDHLAVLSGRIGFELVAKAAVAGLPILAAVGAPSDLAVRTADRLGITLVGFLRAGAGNIYTHPHRLDLRG